VSDEDDEFDKEMAAEALRSDDDHLLNDLKYMITQYDAEKPRSQQLLPGPSGAAHPCMRHHAYAISRARKRFLGIPEARGLNRFNNPLPSIQGTAMHEWLEKAVEAANRRLTEAGKPLRWLSETHLIIRPEERDEEGNVLREQLAGTCDLYDVQTKTVIDWKNPGATAHKKVVEHGLGEVYRGQAHLYGAGFVKLGFPVETVGVVFIPKGGTMRGIHMEREPYNPELVEEILARLDDVEYRMKVLDVENNPNNFLRIPTTPLDCNYCHWWEPKNPQGPFQCEGKL